MVEDVKRLFRPRRSSESVEGQVLLTVGTNVGLAVLGLITGMMAARLLGPMARGELAAIQMWPGFLQMLAMVGLNEALVYYSAQDTIHAGNYLGSALAIGLVSSAAFVAVGYLFMPVLLSAQSAGVIASARWYLLLLPLGLVIGMPNTLLQGRGDFVVWNALRVMPSSIWLLLLVVAWRLGRSDPHFLALGYLVALAAAAPIASYIVFLRIPGTFGPRPHLFGPLLRYGLPSVASGVPQLLNFRLDQMMMASLLPALTLGLYVVAVAWSGVFAPLLSALAMVLFPRIASQPSEERRVHLLAVGSRLTFAATAFLTVLAVLCTPWILPVLFGTQFKAAVPAALVLVVAAGVTGFNLVLENGVRGLGRPDAVMWAECGGLVVTIITLAALLKPLEMMGAAIASFMGYSTVTALLMVQVQRMTGRSMAAFLWPTRQDIGLGWARIREQMSGVMPE